MLPVQVSYWSLKETERSNKAREQLQSESQAETKRHNIESERLGWSSLAETKRHNQASESIGFAQIGLGYAQLNEASRHNLAVEGIQQQQAYASLSQAESSRINALTQQERAKYQNQYDTARTHTETSMLPYKKWESVATTVSRLAGPISDFASGFLTLLG